MPSSEADLHPLLPICSCCQTRSAVFSVVEQYDLGSRARVLCLDCLRDRALSWERYAVHVQVTRLDHRYQSS